jgi:hypothetical protein
MSAYELYRCIREDGTSKDWAVRINPDGTVTTRWGRTGRKLINIQTRKVDPEHLKRSKAKKGYIRVGHFDIDVLGDLIPESSQIQGSEFTKEPLTLRWQLTFGAGVVGHELRDWRERVIVTLNAHGVLIEEASIPDVTRSGSGHVHCDDLNAFLGLLLLKQATPDGVGFTFRTADHREIDAGDLPSLQRMGLDLSSIRPLAESLGLLEPRMDLRMAILSDRHCWF